jgi:hypothetical protein
MQFLFLFLQFMYSKLKKISFYIILTLLLNNPTSALSVQEMLMPRSHAILVAISSLMEWILINAELPCIPVQDNVFGAFF